MRLTFAAVTVTAALAILAAQQHVRPKDVREIGKGGSSAIPRLQELLKYPATDVRVEAVKQITEIGPPRSLDPLILATQDHEIEVQILATDGLVNFYLPGYVKSGFGSSLVAISALTLVLAPARVVPPMFALDPSVATGGSISTSIA